MSLLFGEHAFILAKLSVAASAGRKDEVHAYAELLAVNGGDLTDLFNASIGSTEGAQFNQVWTSGNNAFVDYLVAVVKHDQGAAGKAASKLTGTYVPELVQLLTRTLQIPSDTSMRMAEDQVISAKAFMDDQLAGRYAQSYTDVRVAYEKSTGLGDVIASRMAIKFADKFPGDAASKAAMRRVQLDGLLQEHALLATMTTEAAVSGGQPEEAAAAVLLAAVTANLASMFEQFYGPAAASQTAQVWSTEDVTLVAYATAPEGATKQDRLAAVQASGPQLAQVLRLFGKLDLNLDSEVAATVQVVDDQRGKAFAAIATDDRAAARQLVAVGDAVSGAAHA